MICLRGKKNPFGRSTFNRRLFEQRKPKRIIIHGIRFDRNQILVRTVAQNFLEVCSEISSELISSPFQLRSTQNFKHYYRPVTYTDWRTIKRTHFINLNSKAYIHWIHFCELIFCPIFINLSSLKNLRNSDANMITLKILEEIESIFLTFFLKMPLY